MNVPEYVGRIGRSEHCKSSLASTCAVIGGTVFSALNGYYVITVAGEITSGTGLFATY